MPRYINNKMNPKKKYICRIEIDIEIEIDSIELHSRSMYWQQLSRFLRRLDICRCISGIERNYLPSVLTILLQHLFALLGPLWFNKGLRFVEWRRREFGFDAIGVLVFDEGEDLVEYIAVFPLGIYYY